MASWFDIFAFTLTLAAFVGVIIGVKFIVNQISSTVASTKETLKNRGLTISDKGVSVQTSSRFSRSREDYVDATQRGFIKAMGAASFSTANNVDENGDSGAGANSPLSEKRSLSSHPVLARHESSTSVRSNGSASEKSSSEKEMKKRRFGLKKRQSES